MPIYEAHCDSCNEEYDVICKVSERENVVCNCGATPRFLVSICHTIGAMPSKPIVVGGVGQFETNQDYRDWLKHNPNCEVISTKDPDWKRRLNDARTKANDVVQKWGFRDTHHWSDVTKKEQTKGGSAFTA